MFISHEKRVIFVAVPKAATDSMRSILNSHFNGIEFLSSQPGEHHMSATQIHEELYNHDEFTCWDDYFSFAFVRNPWDREVSLYNYRIKAYDYFSMLPIEKLTRQQQEFYEYNKQFLAKYDNFKDAVMNVGSREQIWYTHVMKKKPQLNFIGRFENLDNDFGHVCEILNIDHVTLSKTNASNHLHYTEYYDDESREIIKHRYKNDIEHFGYKFD